MQWGGALNLFDATLNAPITVRTFGSFDGVIAHPEGAAYLAPIILKAVEAAATAQGAATVLHLERKKDDIAKGALLQIGPQLQQVGAVGQISITAFSFDPEDMDRLQAAAGAAAKEAIARKLAEAGAPAAAAPRPPPAVGSNVLVQWADGNRYPGVLREHRGDQVLVGFPDGSMRWIATAYVSVS